MCLFCTTACGIWESITGQYFRSFLPWDALIPNEPVGGATVIALFVFFSYAIVLNTVVPISLYVSVEVLSAPPPPPPPPIPLWIRPLTPAILLDFPGHPAGAEFPHQLGPADVLRQVQNGRQGPHHHTQRRARPDRVHLLRQGPILSFSVLGCLLGFVHRWLWLRPDSVADSWSWQ